MEQRDTAKPEIITNPPLEVGEKAIVEPQGVGTKFASHFLGWEAERFVALAPPADLELREQLYPGKPLIVRFLGKGGQVLGFESTVQGLTFKPQKMLFISYPYSAQSLSLRKKDRVDCYLPSTLVVDGEELGGTVVNISSGGCLFIVRPEDADRAKALPESTEAFLLSRLYAMDTDLYLNSSVMSVKSTPAKTALGLRFQNLERDVEEQLEQFVINVSMYLGLSCANSGL